MFKYNFYIPSKISMKVFPKQRLQLIFYSNSEVRLKRRRMKFEKLSIFSPVLTL